TVESWLQDRAEQGDWDGALLLIDAQWTSRQIDRASLNRRRAVLLNAKSLAQLDTVSLAARNAAQEAVRLATDFVPAALAVARALFRNDDIRKGSKVLEAIWKKAPHPQVAALYVRARPAGSTHDRLAPGTKTQS